MYDMVRTRQSLPSERYRLLLGTALSVFSSNNGFIIENILDTDSSYSWYELIDKESGRLMKHIKKLLQIQIRRLLKSLVKLLRCVIVLFTVLE